MGEDTEAKFGTETEHQLSEAEKELLGTIRKKEAEEHKRAMAIAMTNATVGVPDYGDKDTRNKY